jgi:hypothetical protein
MEQAAKVIITRVRAVKALLQFADVDDDVVVVLTAHGFMVPVDPDEIEHYRGLVDETITTVTAADIASLH